MKTLGAALLLCIASSATALTCESGYGGALQEIPEEWMNDGYCDCPLDGADEPNTAACSGSGGWDGMKNLPQADNR